VTTGRHEANLPNSVVAMLVADVLRRLEAMTQAIVDGHVPRRNYQRPRIEDILQSLEASADETVCGDPAVFRSVRRMVILAAVQNDPDRCKQAIALLGRIANSAALQS
jgi:flagellin-specific chaperone FliS